MLDACSPRVLARPAGRSQAESVLVAGASDSSYASDAESESSSPSEAAVCQSSESEPICTGQVHTDSAWPVPGPHRDPSP